MRRGTVAGWSGVLILVGTGIVLLVRTQMVNAAKAANAAIVEFERESSEAGQTIVIGESKQKPDAELSRPNGDGHVRRTAMGSSLSPALPSPPLPSRVLPGQMSKSDQAAPETQRHRLPSPQAPSKSLPDVIPERAQDESDSVSEADLSDLM